MQVEDGLAGAGADVEHGAVAILYPPLARDLSRDQMAVSNYFRVLGDRFLQTTDVFLGNHEYVHRRLRMKVLKGVSVLVFKDFLRWNFSLNDAAE